MADSDAVIVCEEMVAEPPGYWHEHMCGRRAKFLVDGREKREWIDGKQPVCGTHVKWYQRWRADSVEPLGRKGTNSNDPTSNSEPQTDGRESVRSETDRTEQNIGRATEGAE